VKYLDIVKYGYEDVSVSRTKPYWLLRAGGLSAGVARVENQREMYRAHNRLHHAHALNYASGGHEAEEFDSTSKIIRDTLFPKAADEAEARDLRAVKKHRDGFGLDLEIRIFRYVPPSPLHPSTLPTLLRRYTDTDLQGRRRPRKKDTRDDKRCSGRGKGRRPVLPASWMRRTKVAPQNGQINPPAPRTRRDHARKRCWLPPLLLISISGSGVPPRSPVGSIEI